MKVHVFESESWIKAAWQATGTKLDTVWIEGLLTPHCAFFTREAAERLMTATVGNIEAFVAGETRNVIV